MNSPHKGPVTRKILPFDDVMTIVWWLCDLDPMKYTPNMFSSEQNGGTVANVFLIWFIEMKLKICWLALKVSRFLFVCSVLIIIIWYFARPEMVADCPLSHKILRLYNSHLNYQFHILLRTYYFTWIRAIARFSRCLVKQTWTILSRHIEQKNYELMI